MLIGGVMYTGIVRVVLCTIMLSWSAFGQLGAQAPSAAEMLSVNTTQGTEFWIAIPPNEKDPFPVDELEIYVASAYDTDVQLYDAAANRTITRKVTKGTILTL